MGLDSGRSKPGLTQQLRDGGFEADRATLQRARVLQQPARKSSAHQGQGSPSSCEMTVTRPPAAAPPAMPPRKGTHA